MRAMEQEFAMFDILIRNGTVVDGTGAAKYSGDIGIVNGMITELGVIADNAQAHEVVEASGKVVSPGFIDIHTHADIALLARPQHLPKIMQGVTTEVFTNCGLGFAPINDLGMEIQRKNIAGLFGDDGSNDPESSHPVDWCWKTVADFLSRFENQGTGTNIAYLIPHGSIRVSIMGMEERTADAAELEAMNSMVRQGMEEGAWGLSTGIWYAPMRAAAREELIRLCKSAGFFATHQRDYGEKIFEATNESLEIARGAEVPVQIAHLQMNGIQNEGRAPDILEVLTKARASGIDVTCDTYPYTAGSTFVQSLLPPSATQEGPEGVLRKLSNSAKRTEIIAFFDTWNNDWSKYNLVGASSKLNAPQEGKTFLDGAGARGLTIGEYICSILEEEDLRACFVHHAAHEGNVSDILQWDHQMVGSDGLHLPGKTHPRLYSTFPRILGRYVRETKVLSLESAIHKMTGIPAARLGLPGRGLLKKGYAADIVIFDAATVHDVGTFEDPLQYPVGLSEVFVNGIAVKRNNESTGKLPGTVLRKK